jgi:hypothetical protein
MDDKELILKRYWKNENKIKDLAATHNCQYEDIVYNSENFSNETVLQLEQLLIEKENLLEKILIIKKTEVLNQEIVDLNEYKKLIY